jgi:uracil-DNA glycosylase
MKNSDSVSAEQYLPERPTLPRLREAVQSCRGCDLYKNATQAVFGEGPRSARIVFIGEQPGDEEDLKGHPFVGPAGRLFDRALQDAGIDRSEVYVTNSVKHFRFEERGKRRLHKKPRQSQIDACSPWLKAELEIVRPKVLVCLGATAARALFGPLYKLTKERGRWTSHPWAADATSTVHPSSLLRIPDSADRKAAYENFVEELRAIKKRIG